MARYVLVLGVYAFGVSCQYKAARRRWVEIVHQFGFLFLVRKKSVLYLHVCELDRVSDKGQP
jgi:hypothetical protein